MRRLCVALFVVFLLAFQGAGLFADIVTVTLKNGQVLTGELTAETATQITLDVAANASGTIIATKIIAQSDINKLEHETDAQKARRLLAEDYRNTQKYQLTDSSFPKEYYDQIIDGSFRPFLIKHPDSPNTNEISLKITAWTAERDKVAAGSTRRGDQWFDTAATSIFLEQTQTSATLKEGDRLLGISLFYAAVMKYRDALNVKPLTTNTLDLIAQRVEAAAKTWKAEVASGADLSGTAVQLYDSQNRRVLPQRAELHKTTDGLLVLQRLIASAKLVEVRPGVNHWMAENPGHLPARYDFGRELPDANANAVELQKDQATIRKLDETIAANNALIQKHQGELLPASVRLRNIGAILQQVADDLAQARTALNKLEAEAALKNAAPSTPAAPTNQVATAEVAPPAASFSLVTWFKTYWIWLAVGGVVVLYATLRTLDH